MQTNIEKLKERIEQNREDFRDDILGLMDGASIYDMARRVAAVEDAYELTQDTGWIDEAEAAYLLEFAEPLKMLADAWEDLLFDTTGDFRMVVEDVLDADDNNENYITAVYAEELKRKYGAGVNIRDALFQEVMETGKRITLLKNMLDDEGVDYCLNEV